MQIHLLKRNLPAVLRFVESEKESVFEKTLAGPRRSLRRWTERACPQGSAAGTRANQYFCSRLHMRAAEAADYVWRWFRKFGRTKIIFAHHSTFRQRRGRLRIDTEVRHGTEQNRFGSASASTATGAGPSGRGRTLPQFWILDGMSAGLDADPFYRHRTACRAQEPDSEAG